MHDEEVVEPEEPQEDAALLAERETILADREAQRAVEQRQDREASISTWARRVHERSAQLHDQAEMAHRDAAELHALQAEHESRRPAEESPAETSE